MSGKVEGRTWINSRASLVRAGKEGQVGEILDASPPTSHVPYGLAWTMISRVCRRAGSSHVDLLRSSELDLCIQLDRSREIRVCEVLELEILVGHFH